MPDFSDHYHVVPTDAVLSMRTDTALRRYGSDVPIMAAELGQLQAFPFCELTTDAPQLRSRLHKHMEPLLTPEALFETLEQRLITDNRFLLNAMAYELAVELASRHPEDKKLAKLVNEHSRELAEKGPIAWNEAKKELMGHLRTLPEFAKGQALAYSISFAKRHFYSPEQAHKNLQDFIWGGFSRHYCHKTADLASQSLKKIDGDPTSLTAQEVFDANVLQQGRKAAIAADMPNLEETLLLVAALWEKRLKAQGCADPFRPAFTQAEADAAIKALIARFPKDGPSAALARICLDRAKHKRSEDVTFIVSATSESHMPIAPNFYVSLNEVMQYSQQQAHGACDVNAKHIDIAVNHPNAPMHLLHELTHYGIGIVYNNDDHNPWLDPKDARRKLFTEAVRADRNLNGEVNPSMRSVATQLLGTAGMAKGDYTRDQFGAEMVVRIMDHMSAHTWDAEHAQSYPHLTRFVTTIMGADVARFERGETLKPMTDKEADDYRKGAPIQQWRDTIKARASQASPALPKPH